VTNDYLLLVVQFVGLGML